MITTLFFNLLGILLIALASKFVIPEKTGRGRNGRGEMEQGVLRRAISFKLPARIIGGIIIFVTCLSTSFISIGPDEVGHLDKKYGFSTLESGVIATKGEKGYQAQLKMPGVQFHPLINVIYKVDKRNIEVIPEGMVGLLTAKDGAEIPKGFYIAESWENLIPDDRDPRDMLDAKTFLENGGQKGPQLEVLKPGKHRINRYLWSVSQVKAKVVPPGSVLVIKSNVGKEGEDGCVSKMKPVEGVAMAAPLVEKGCFGIWDEPEMPGTYYLNTKAYQPYIVQTRAFQWTYKGGFTKRDVVANEVDGVVSVSLGESYEVQKPDKAADTAIKVLTVDAYEFFTEWTVQGQVEPANAPFMIASIGSITNAEDTVVTPVMRSEVRNAAETVKGSSFLGKRKSFENRVEIAIKGEGKKFGITIAEARMRNPGMPAQLQVAIMRKDLAKKNKLAFDEEKKEQKARVAMEKEKATADNQSIVVTAKLERAAANDYKAKRKKEAEADRYYEEQTAKGVAKKVAVLGAELTAKVEMFKAALATLEKCPECVKNPQVLVEGGAGGMTAAAALLGRNTFSQALNAIGDVKQSKVVVE